MEDALGVPISVAALKGVLTCFLGEAVNYVNAEKVAAQRGIEVVRAAHAEAGDYPHLVRVTAGGEQGEIDVAGTLFAQGDARVVSFRGFRLEFRPEGRLLVLQNRDVPGVVGRLGTILGEAGINIAEIHLARVADKGDAMAVLRLDAVPAEETMARIEGLAEIQSVRLADLR
jgi:D-3-phosphoglycerate dehydrogenase